MTRKSEYLKDEMVDEWLDLCDFKEQTVVGYCRGLQLYCEMYEMTPTALIKEAESDLKSDKLPRQYQIKRKLASFEKWLNNEKSPKTNNFYMAGIRSFYRTFEIPLPNSSNRRHKIQTLMKNDWDGFGKNVVRDCLKVLNKRNRAIILVMASSGLGRTEILNLKKSDVKDIDRQDITTIKLQRQKTDVKFTTFLSPEATQAIREYLKERVERAERFAIDDNCPYLFVTMYKRDFQKLEGAAFNKIFLDLVVKMGKEYQTEKGTFNMLRSHNFRKFFKTQMQNNGLPMWQVEHQMGHELPALEKAYFIEDEHKMKENYIKHLDAVMVEHEVQQVTIEESEEFQKLQAELTEIKREYELNKHAHELALKKIVEMDMTAETITKKVLQDLHAHGVIAVKDYHPEEHMD